MVDVQAEGGNYSAKAENVKKFYVVPLSKTSSAFKHKLFPERVEKSS